ncbi:PSD1 and planctomycete cytochrome C domain-containing protein [Gimesia fumaroli]|uniref:Planctomycete cytochrome C n=1 Tax=Gimesia fumaroli TaxID=2527976 RepID=A0A518IDL9_9PLAN|nr:PSD1 and planctomycete cytochrome C domain-containing protein [Gimesia fumaroli]QDV51196.1 Planctomycete cytochrome C [Gimesia fumaroli]
MSNQKLRTTFLTAIYSLLILAGQTSFGANEVDFRENVAPILQRHCLSCHNDRVRRGGLSLHSAQATSKGGESGPSIDPSDPDASYLIDLITPTEGTAEMPRDEPPLSEKEVATIRNWIKAGAVWPADFEIQPPVLWSLKPLHRPTVPSDFETNPEFPIRNPIDAFVAARHKLNGLEPAPEASRRTLIRRLYLDLTGLLPTPEAVESFVSDEDPHAYEQLVDELLASPHFGERWGRYWLDLARYADSDGYLGDSMRRHAWVYREWVIDAINQDLPFDQFSIEQLAGDLLDKPTLSQKIATGFHRNTLSNTEAGVDLELYRTKEIVDRVNTTGMVWLGFTFGCAECHDHKHDPISQKEFYQIYAFFNNANETTAKVKKPWENAEYEQARTKWEPQYQQLLSELKAYENTGLTKKQQTEITEILNKYKKTTDLKRLSPFYQTKKAGWKELSAKLAKQLQTKPSPPATRAPIFTERTKDRRDTFVHVRGIYNRPGEKVSPDTPFVLPDLSSRNQTPDRLDLAQWLFQNNNPLTPRVSVNRIWQHLFGQGLVSTPNDFGTKGAVPTHPQLLDWLATEYKSRGWSRKAMIRLLVMSSTYRMSSASNARSNPQDINNQLLWRQNSYRLEAEIVRDIHLTASGLLDRTIGRRGIRPPLPAFVTDVGRSVKWPASQGSERYRRGMYIVFKRTVPYPMLMTFDAPDATVSCSRRERSNTPLQALTLLNGPMFFESAQVLGKEMHEHYPDDFPSAMNEMFMRCLGRPANEREQNALSAAYSDLLQVASQNNIDSAEKTSPQLTALIQVARIIMNLDEFITRD